MAARKNAIVELFWKIHPKLYAWTGGRVGGQMMGMPVLLLTTTGRKSGKARTSALMYLPKGDNYIVIASYLGQPKHPAWWLNLRATREAEVRVGAKRIRVSTREADGDERAELWREIVDRQSDYAEYQLRTTRRLPVVVLQPR